MNNIVHPLTFKTYSVFSLEGKNLLKKYVQQVQNGGAQGIPPKVQEVYEGALDKWYSQYWDINDRDLALYNAKKSAKSEAIRQGLTPLTDEQADEFYRRR
jgi:hypothetical protein